MSMGGQIREIPDALSTHVKAFAESLAEDLAKKAAAEYERGLRAKLVSSIVVLMESTMSFERMGPDLRVVIKNVSGTRAP